MPISLFRPITHGLPFKGLLSCSTSWATLQDGAYATWQKMVALKIVPNVITQRALASAFSNNPQMAAALVKEAQQLQASSSAILLFALGFRFSAQHIEHGAAYRWTAASRECCESLAELHLCIPLVAFLTLSALHLSEHILSCSSPGLLTI